MNRPPNEVRTTGVVLADILVAGEMLTDIVVERGPSPEARIVGTRWEGETETIVLIYDRPVDEPVLKVVHHSW